MKRIWDLCAFEWLRVLKKPQNYLFMFAMPLLFTFLFGSLLSGNSPKPMVAWVDEDHSFLSARYEKDMQKNPLFQLKKVSPAQAKQWFREKKVSGLIMVDKGFQKQLLEGNKPKVTFQHGPEFSGAMAIKQALNHGVDQMHIIATAALQGERPQSPDDWQSLYRRIDHDVRASAQTVRVEAIFKHKNQLEMDNTSARAAGFSIMFVMIEMISVTGALLEAKRSGVWYRLMATPSSRFQILAGYFLSFFLIGWVQFAVLMLSSSLLFDVHWGNPVALMAFVSAVLLAVVGLGLFIAGFVKTTEQQAALGNLIVVSTSMLGGVYWPLDVVPNIMQKIAQFVPQKWAMDGFTELIARGGSLADIAMPAAVLLGFAALFIIVGMSRMKYE
jgi:ABC-2 type transport system permease protein